MEWFLGLSYQVNCLRLVKLGKMVLLFLKERSDGVAEPNGQRQLVPDRHENCETTHLTVPSQAILLKN